jgi:hypothetical protein
MDLIETIATYLSAHGISEPIHGLTLPTGPDTVVAICDTGGYKPEIQSTTRYPTFEVLCRSIDYVTAKTISMSIFDLLHDQQFLKLSEDIVVIASEAMSDPTPMGQDENDRWIVACNYRFTIRR